MIDSKLYKEWLMLEKDQQLSEKEKGDVERKESMDENCSQSDLSPGQRVC